MRIRWIETDDAGKTSLMEARFPRREEIDLQQAMRALQRSLVDIRLPRSLRVVILPRCGRWVDVRQTRGKHAGKLVARFKISKPK